MPHSSIEAVSAVHASKGSSGSASSLSQEEQEQIIEQQNTYNTTQQQAINAQNTSQTQASTQGISSVESNWGFSAEEAHKLYENLCTSVVNQIKQDQDQMTQALQQLQQSTAIPG